MRVILALLDPDPYPADQNECGSGSATLVSKGHKLELSFDLDQDLFHTYSNIQHPSKVKYICRRDLSEWLERLAINAQVLGSIPASSDTVEAVLYNVPKTRKKKYPIKCI